jgi:hypothetical protein
MAAPCLSMARMIENCSALCIKAGRAGARGASHPASLCELRRGRPDRASRGHPPHHAQLRCALGGGKQRRQPLAARLREWIFRLPAQDGLSASRNLPKALEIMSRTRRIAPSWAWCFAEPGPDQTPVFATVPARRSSSSCCIASGTRATPPRSRARAPLPSPGRHCEERLRRSNPVLVELMASGLPRRFAPRNDGCGFVQFNLYSARRSARRMG